VEITIQPQRGDIGQDALSNPMARRAAEVVEANDKELGRPDADIFEIAAGKKDT
jgi:hypothetical protein